MPRRKLGPNELSKQQKAVLNTVKDFNTERGYCPTIREIGELMNLRSPSTVHAHVNTLIEKGYLKRDNNLSRTISVVDMNEEEPQNNVSSSTASHTQTNSFSKIIDLPLVGNVAAGEPILAEQNISEYISLPTDIVGDSPSFLLHVRGDSMIEIGINDGDYVVVKEQPVANNGDIVVAIVDEEGATVKRFFKEADHIRLQPENSSMEPIITRNCSIAGKVVAVFRRL